MIDFLTLDDLGDVQGKTVLLRSDLNVPFRDGRVTDDSRLMAMLPTLHDLRDKGCKIVVLSHFGRPEGKKNPAYSLRPVAERLNHLWGKNPIGFIADCIGPTVAEAISKMNNGDIIVCENLRFHAGETANDAEFAAVLARSGDIFVNDAFSAAHRAHASTVGLAALLPAYAGRLMEAELNALSSALENPQSPITAIVGGAKVSTKLSVLHNLIKKVDHLVLGGGMANTFLYAQGHNVGTSLYEPDMKAEALDIIKTANRNQCLIHLPSDVIVAQEFKENAAHETCAVDMIPADAMALDLGPDTVQKINAVIQDSQTLLWNGPLGAFETKPFDTATLAVARFAAMQVEHGRLYAIGGGGDTVAALDAAGVKDKFSYISTAGGAFLEYIEGKPLPGVQALKSKTGKS